MSGIHPTHYRITLEPDLERFQFSGTAEITLETEFSVDEIALNAIDLTVTTCGVRRAAAIVPCLLSLDLKKEALKIRLPEAICGQFVLVITYQGQLCSRGPPPICGCHPVSGKRCTAGVSMCGPPGPESHVRH